MPPPTPRFDAPGCFPINTQVSGDIVTVYAEMDRSNSFKNHFPKNVDTVSSRKINLVPRVFRKDPGNEVGVKCHKPSSQVLGRVVRRSDNAIHRIVIFSTFVKCLKKCETTDIDDTRSVKKHSTYKY